MRTCLKLLGFLATLLSAPAALAATSAELLTAESYGYGRVEARVRFAPGDGVVSSIFLWKDGSERAGTFWNELDFEKLGANCRLETNPIYGNPSANHSQRHALELDLCGAFHTYTYEWTPEAIAWLVDGVEIRRETGAVAQAFAENAGGGMQIRFNLWPGDASFGGNFDPASLPVHEYVDWVQFSAYDGGAFELLWREDFDGATLPAGWLTGNWPSPKNKSTHAPENVNFIDGYAVLSLTTDEALGPAGAMPEGSGGTTSNGGTSSGGTSGSSAADSSLGARPNVDGCSTGGGSDQRPVLGPLAALALAFLSYRARRRDR
jgi:MYXO-CTERM domain-containing protein